MGPTLLLLLQQLCSHWEHSLLCLWTLTSVSSLFFTWTWLFSQHALTHPNHLFASARATLTLFREQHRPAANVSKVLHFRCPEWILTWLNVINYVQPWSVASVWVRLYVSLLALPYVCSRWLKMLRHPVIMLSTTQKTSGNIKTVFWIYDSIGLLILWVND